MDKLRMETKDMTQENIKKLAELFPNVVTEIKDENGNLKKGINFELLKQELSGDVIDGEESYDFTWVGKRAAMVEANTPIRKTLRPCLDESKNWETTENLYIEGDNLDALKLLQESYLNSVKMIYIDPPYNTGNDSFVYPDNYFMDTEEYEEGIEYRDDEGNIQFRKNNETNPRFHSDWCSMMYSRLKLAKNLLSEDGAIFISIDDNEVHTLKYMCNEVFGEKNFLICCIWVSGRTSSAHFTNSHEYVLAYAKNLPQLPLFRFLNGAETISDRTIKRPSAKNPLSIISFPAGIDFECEDKVFPSSFGGNEPIRVVEGILECKNGKLANPVRIEAAWTMRDMIVTWLRGESVYDQKGQKVNRFFFKSNGILQYEKEKGTIHPNSVIQDITTKSGSIELNALFGRDVFSFPKPPRLIEYFSPAFSASGDIILDFFAGSSTTAHAVMKLNAEDGGNRKYIMVQLPEETDEKSEAFKAGYKTISDIGKERIRRAGEKIKAEIEEANAKLKDGEEPKKVPDIGFRVLKVDTTNMKDVYYAANEITQEQLFNMKSNIKEDRTDLDLLYGALVDWGLPLSLSHETETIEGIAVHTVDHGSLIACFAEDVPETVVRAIAKRQPLRVVFRDSSFSSSPEKINVEEIFKLLAPNTSVRVI